MRLAFGLDLGGWRAEVDGFPSLLLDGASGVRLSSSVLSPSELKDLVLDDFVISAVRETADSNPPFDPPSISICAPFPLPA